MTFRDVLPGAGVDVEVVQRLAVVTFSLPDAHEAN
jgi:hypothetical protein